MRIKGNIEHRTSNTERRTAPVLRCSMFDVRCSMFPRLLLTLAISALSVGFIALSQPTTAAHVKGFRVPQYYEPPHETQMKSLLEGAEAEPQPGGLIHITNLK